MVTPAWPTPVDTHLDLVEPCVLLCDVHEALEALQRRGGAARLEDEPAPRDEHGALAQHVRVDHAVALGADDLALHQAQHRHELVPGEGKGRGGEMALLNTKFRHRKSEIKDSFFCLIIPT